MISGGVKFFEKPFNLFKDGTSITASTGQFSAKYILDTNIYTAWESVGSNDITNEELIISMPSAKSINRIFLTEFNLKSFEILYFNGAAFVPFTNVIGPNGISYTGINVTNYDTDSAYFEFSEVNTSIIKIIAKTTQVANQEKTITKFLVTSEIGTLKGFPRVDTISDRNEEKVKTLGGKFLVQKSFETVQIRMNFKTHPYVEDNDLIELLFDRDETFLIYPCGGRYGSQYFKVAQKTWRLKDVFNVQVINNLDNRYEKGVYTLGVTKDITFTEHI